jgi:hypothetical protein
MQYEAGQITVKFRLAGSEDVRRISINKHVTLAELKENMARILKCDQCEVQYQHEDGRLLSINSDEELKVAITLSLAKIPPILRISVNASGSPQASRASPIHSNNNNVNFPGTGLQQANPAEKPVADEAMAVDPVAYTVITIVDEGPSTAPHSPRSLEQIHEANDQQMKLEPAQNQENNANNNINDIIAPINNNNNAMMAYHEAVCHVCDNVIVGIRYKCFECVDYDLCEKCEQVPDVHPASHMLLKVKVPEKYGLLPSKKYFKKIGQAPNKKYFQKWEKKVLKHHSKSKKAIEKYFSKIGKLGKHLRSSKNSPRDNTNAIQNEISNGAIENLTVSDRQLIDEFTMLKGSVDYEVLDSSSDHEEESAHLLGDESEHEAMAESNNNVNMNNGQIADQQQETNSWQSSLMRNIINHQEERRLMSAEDNNQTENKQEVPAVYKEYFPQLWNRLHQSEFSVNVDSYSAPQPVTIDVDTVNNNTTVVVSSTNEGSGSSMQVSVHCEPSAPVIEEHHQHEAPKEEYMVPADFAHYTQLVELLDAGFTDVAINVQLLNHHNGSLEAVFDALLSHH